MADTDMKIYFSGSVSGGREDVALYLQIILQLKEHGLVLTEHIGDARLDARGEPGLGVAEIHEGPEKLGLLARFLGILFGQQRLAAVHVAAGFQRYASQDRLEPRVQPDVCRDVICHGEDINRRLVESHHVGSYLYCRR